MKHINWKTLLHKSEHDMQNVQDLIQSFLDTTPEVMRSLQEAIQLEHACSVEHAAQTIKGSVLPYGARQIVAKASEIESMGGRGELQSAGSCMGELRFLLDELYDDLWYVLDKKITVKPEARGDLGFD